MKKGQSGLWKAFPILLLAGALGFAGCTSVEGDHYENAIRQEQKYQEYISDAKDNDRDVEDTLDEIIDESLLEESSGESASEKTLATDPSLGEASGDTAVTEQNLRFRKKKYLDEHYEKHGIEMGFASAEDYLAAANAVVANPEALHKTEAEDGDDIYYVEETNEFVVVSTDGYIRTYFNPSAGIDYYNRQ